MTLSTRTARRAAQTTLSVRVLPGDMDLSACVQPSRYLRHFEIARIAFLREWSEEASGWDTSVVAAVGFRVLQRIDCDARVDVTCSLQWVRRASVSFRYQVQQEHALMCEGHTDHCVVDQRGWPSRMLDVRRKRLEQLLAEHSDVLDPSPT